VSFDSLALHPKLLRGVQDLGFAAPTPIQRAAIPPALAGRDLLGAAMTGSGKTAAFVLPVLQRLLDGPRGRTRALVLTPTRELAAQIEEHTRALGRHAGLGVAAVIGGVGPAPQEAALRRGVDVVVATPGRLLDHLGSGVARFDALEVLVLDEADRMLDMGFLPDIRRILAALPARRQTLLFSATLPAPIVALAREMLHDPVAVGIDRAPAPATGVAQAVYPVPGELKAPLLVALLRRPELVSVLVFTRTKHRANRLADALERAGVSVARIHGNRSQAQRTAALDGFKAGKYRVLVATDIAARGIDVTELSHVVNFDVPLVPEDYVHRVGRTARAQATGDAITLVSPDEEGDLRAIERAVGARLPRLTVPGFDYARRPAERLEVPIAERIAAIRAQRAQERARARAKAERRAAGPPSPSGASPAARPPAAGPPARPGGAGPAAPGRPAWRPDGPGPRGASPRRGPARWPGR
jgi:ATP-dependent RNA helicase RhlE